MPYVVDHKMHMYNRKYGKETYYRNGVLFSLEDMTIIISKLQNRPRMMSLFIISITSCKKDPVVRVSSSSILPVPPSPLYTSTPGLPLPPFGAVHDYLSGSEYTFNNLIWKGDWAVYVEVPNSILFMKRGIEVSIDSSATEITVPFYTLEYPEGTFPYPRNKGYIYDNNWFTDLFVFAIGSDNRHLVGTKVSIKVKVL